MRVVCVFCDAKCEFTHLRFQNRTIYCDLIAWDHQFNGLMIFYLHTTREYVHFKVKIPIWTKIYLCYCRRKLINWRLNIIKYVCVRVRIPEEVPIVWWSLLLEHFVEESICSNDTYLVHQMIKWSEKQTIHIWITN